MKYLFLPVVVCLAYLFLSFLLIGYRTDQLVLVAIFLTCYGLHPFTRKFILGFSIYIVYWIVFDAMKLFPNYSYAPVNIEGLYQLEKFWFGVNTSSGRQTFNEFFFHHSHFLLDLLCGFFYLTWVPVPLMVAFWFFVHDRMRFLTFSFSFVTINMLGFVVYYLYPAAPPWYVAQHGFNLHLLTPGNPAGLQRFDALVHSPVFAGIYSKSSNVFAAMPSLHSAYPLLVLYTGLKYELGYINIFFATCMLGIWFAAVYTSHHYVLDVLAGIVCGIAGILLFEKVLCRIPFVKVWLGAYFQKIS